MKRSINELDHSVTMANCLMLLSRGNDQYDSLISTSTTTSSSSSPSRVFECKTCNRQFPSFQALGGHRASHKKPRLGGGGAGGGGDGSSSDHSHSSSSPRKPKTHECNICGLEFAIGQALGGHMRRHRAIVTTENSNNNHHQRNRNEHGLSSNLGRQVVVPVLKKTNSMSRRVLCLDLNLTPFENDMEILGIGKTKTPPLVEFIF